MKDFAKVIVKSPATFIIVVLLLLITLLVTVRASAAKSSTSNPFIIRNDIELSDRNSLD